MKMSPKHIILFLLIAFCAQTKAQRHYLYYDHSLYQSLPSQANWTDNGISGKLDHCEGTYSGGTFDFAINKRNSICLGMGVSKMRYKKEWLGIFPESNQFGAVLLDGKIEQWSFPLSYRWNFSFGPRGLNRCYRGRRERLYSSVTLTYCPSVLAKSSYNASAAGGADLALFMSAYKSDEQSFQHSLFIGFNEQLSFFDNWLSLGIEPYAGIGSGYFSANGTGFNNVAYGVHFRIGIEARFPELTIEREVPAGNPEKKKQLEEKQKEIKDQLNKQPNNHTP